MARYEIAGVTYSSQKAVRDRASRCLDRERVLSGDDEQFVLGLLERHPYADAVKGVGVRRVVVKRVLPYNTRGFYVERVDGTGTDFSYLKCLRGKPTDPRDNFNAACRTAVVPQVQAARADAFKTSILIKCPITSALVAQKDAHVDHAPPWTFQAIVDAFIEHFSVDVDAVEYVGYSSTTHLDGSVERRFSSPGLAQQFATFHAARAVLWVVSRQANLSVLRRHTND